MRSQASKLFFMLPVIFFVGFIILFLISLFLPSLWVYVLVVSISWVVADMISFLFVPSGTAGRPRNRNGKFMKVSVAYLITIIVILIASWIGTTFSELIMKEINSFGPLGLLFASLLVPAILFLDFLDKNPLIILFVITK